MDLTKMKIRLLHRPVAKACDWLMLDVAVTICAKNKWDTLRHFQGTLTQFRGTLSQLHGHLETVSQVDPP